MLLTRGCEQALLDLRVFWNISAVYIKRHDKDMFIDRHFTHKFSMAMAGALALYILVAPGGVLAEQPATGAQWFSPASNGIVTAQGKTSKRKRIVQRAVRYQATRLNRAAVEWDDSFDTTIARAPRSNIPSIDNPRLPSGVAPAPGYRSTFSSLSKRMVGNPTPVFSKATVIAMQSAIARYEYIVSRGGWKKIPGGPNLRVGSRSPRVALLRARLRVTGDLRQRGGNPNSYDSYVGEAVQHYQKRNGLLQTGAVDARTLKSLNVTASARLAQLKLNLARISKMAQGIGKKFIMVNIAAAELEAVEFGAVRSRHRTVVGKADRQSPLVSSRVIQVNFYPYWHVPQSIVVKDLIPKLKVDPGYLTRTNLRIFKSWGGEEIDPATVDWNDPAAVNFKFRQDPGPANALGFARINFPNKHAVYMHDTPTKGLFSHGFRAYSSGCVRIQNVQELIGWMLKKEKGWEPSRIDEVIRMGESMNVDLTKSIPLYWSYITAWAQPNGAVQFRRDLYGRDGVGMLAANY